MYHNYWDVFYYYSDYASATSMETVLTLADVEEMVKDIKIGEFMAPLTPQEHFDNCNWNEDTTLDL
jgi:hypothetical protein